MPRLQLSAEEVPGHEHITQGRQAINDWLHKLAAEEGRRTRLVDISAARLRRAPRRPSPRSDNTRSDDTGAHTTRRPHLLACETQSSFRTRNHPFATPAWSRATARTALAAGRAGGLKGEADRAGRTGRTDGRKTGRGGLGGTAGRTGLTGGRADGRSRRSGRIRGVDGVAGSR